MKMPLQGRLSITLKIAISLGLLIAFLMATLGLFTAFNLKNTVQAGEEDKGRYLSEVLTGRVSGSLAAGDQPAVKRTAQNFLRETGVEGVVVVDSEGKVVAAEGVSRPGSMMVNLNDFDPTGFKMNYINEKGEADPAFMSMRMVKNNEGSVYGYLGITTSAGYLDQSMRNLTTYVLLATLAAVIAGIFLAIVISRRILNRPITDLASATEHIATGNFSMKVNSRNQDELGNLASSFNMMTGYLSSLFRSITTYTGELVNSCQSLSSAVKSTENASKQLAESMQEHAGRTGEQISMLQGCADLAGDLVQRVEHSGRELKTVAGQIKTVTGDSQEPVRLMADAGAAVEEVKESLDNLKTAAGINLVAFGELRSMAGLFTDYLDRSSAFNFNLALEVARLGGRDLADELDELQKLAGEGIEKTNQYINSIDTADYSVEQIIETMEDSLARVERGEKAIHEAGVCWESLGERLVAESQAIDSLMDSMEENEKQRKQLLESLSYLMEELDRALKEFNGTGEAGEKQTEQLSQLESTLRRILRVSNALNNLCLQFKT